MAVVPASAVSSNVASTSTAAPKKPFAMGAFELFNKKVSLVSRKQSFNYKFFYEKQFLILFFLFFFCLFKFTVDFQAAFLIHHNQTIQCICQTNPSKLLRTKC